MNMIYCFIYLILLLPKSISKHAYLDIFIQIHKGIYPYIQYGMHIYNIKDIFKIIYLMCVTYV